MTWRAALVAGLLVAGVGAACQGGEKAARSVTVPVPETVAAADPASGTAPRATAEREETDTATVEEPAAEPAAPNSPRAPAAGARGKSVAVATVVDGDTIRLVDGRRVRLVQIDTPERGECYGAKASAALRTILPRGTTVMLETDPALDRVDRYGRLLRYVFKGTLNVNLALVKRGAASVWFFEGSRGRYAGQLLAAATAAKQAKRGVWKACPRTRLDPTSGIVALAAAPAPPAPEAQESVAGTCEDVTSYDYNWDNDMLCMRPDGSTFYTDYEGAKRFETNGDE